MAAPVLSPAPPAPPTQAPVAPAPPMQAPLREAPFAEAPPTEVPTPPAYEPPPTVVASPDSDIHTGRYGVWAVTALRLAIGFEFLWAFFDRTFGLGYPTPSAHAWIHGGSPVRHTLDHVDGGPLQSLSHAVASSPIVSWLFMLGLLGVGLALILGVLIRSAAIVGVIMFGLMWIASWPFEAGAHGGATASADPIVNSHLIGALALLTVAAFTVRGVHGLRRWWYERPMVQRHAWLR